MRRFLSIFVFAVFVVALTMSLFACTGNSQPEPTPPTGYTCESAVGGGNLENSNLISASSEVGNNEFVARFEFVSGSVIADTEQTAASNVPSYNISLTKTPIRLTFSIKTPKYTDFVRTFDSAFAQSDWIYGAYFYTCKDDDTLNITVQFKKDVCYATAVQNGVLTIKVSALSELNTANFNYYVTANAYYSYLNARLVGMSPTLTRNNAGEILVSEPYSNETDANAALVKFREQYPELSACFEVVACYDTELPMYNTSLDGANIVSVRPVRVNGVVQSLPIVVSEGLYLADTPSGDMLYAKCVVVGENRYFSLKVTGNTKINVNYEFENIECASYSKDGLKLAVLESTSAGSRLYVFDPTTGELLVNLTDEGIGKRVSKFIWNKTGTAIYAISGTNSIAINMYDFTAIDDANKKSTVYSGAVDESSLGVAGAYLYFVSSDEKGSTIHRMRPESGAASVYAKGSGFAISPDAKKIAITTAEALAMNETATGEFAVIDLDTSDKTVVTSDFGVYEFAWSDDGKQLYYVRDNLSGADDAQTTTATPDQYPYTLYVFDIGNNTSTMLFDMKYSLIRTSKGFNGILLPYFEGDGLCATFAQELTTALPE